MAAYYNEFDPKKAVERQSLALADGVAEGVGRGGNSGFPLAEGQEARIMRLRGYGDGIVAPLAAAFIRAYMEANR